MKKVNFDNLYARAISEWPKEIKLGPLRHYNALNNTYSTRELYLLYDKISESHINTSEEVLMRNLHDAIYSVLHEIAAYCDSIKLVQVRKESVRSKFEVRLSPDRISKKLRWTDDDRKLVRDYFKESQKADSGKNSKKVAKRKKI